MWKTVVVVYMRIALFKNWVNLKKKKVDNLINSRQPKKNKLILENQLGFHNIMRNRN